VPAASISVSSPRANYVGPASAFRLSYDTNCQIKFNYCTQRTMALMLSFTAAKPVCNRVCERTRLKS
jgi:hypothetical protein